MNVREYIRISGFHVAILFKVLDRVASKWKRKDTTAPISIVASFVFIRQVSISDMQ